MKKSDIKQSDMINPNVKDNLFQKKFFMILFATITALTWSFAYPLIKLGFASFHIEGGDTGAKVLFAGIRFFMAGVVVLVMSKIMKHDIKIKSANNARWLILFALVNTTFHYFGFYIGLSFTPGARASVYDSLSTFILIILACIIFKNEHMTVDKVIGCLLGFGGVLLINMTGSTDASTRFTFLGDGMLIISATCAAFGGIITKVVTKKMDTLAATGYSLAFGGVFLVILGFSIGGKITYITPTGVLILCMLILISVIGFSLYNQLLCYNPAGQIAIFNSLIPIMAAILSCLFLGEPFMIKYLVSAVMVMGGIYIINRKTV